MLQVRGKADLPGPSSAAEVSSLEVVSGELARALDALGQITGESATGALLDEVFRRFRVGK